MNHVSLTGLEGYRDEGDERRRRTEDWAISPQIYPVIFSENARVFNILAQ
jgi:hypothetical protein